MRNKWNKIFIIVCMGIFVLVYLQRSISNWMLPEVTMQPITKGPLTESASIQTRIRSETHRFRCLSDVILEDVYVRADMYMYAGEAIASVYPTYIDDRMKEETDTDVLAWLQEIAANGYILRMPEDGFITEVKCDQDSFREKYSILLLYERIDDPDIYLEFSNKKDSLIQVEDTVTLQVINTADAGQAISFCSAKLTKCDVIENEVLWTCVPNESNGKILYSGMQVRINIRKQTDPYDVLVPLSALIPADNREGWCTVRFAVPMQEKENSGHYTVVSKEVKLLEQTDQKAAIQCICGDDWYVITEKDAQVRHLDTVRRAGVW